MKVTLIGYTPNPESLCGEAAAVCTGSPNASKALEHSVGSGHLSVLEHASFTFKVEGVSRAALAQLTRHRIASFSVQSQRYVKLKVPALVIPESIKESAFAGETERLMAEVMDLYTRMTECGIPAEDARFITPQAVPTTLFVTMNARELLHFFALRTCNRAQWEIRDMADWMLRICKEVAPKIFENAGPGCVRGFCPEKRSCGTPRNLSEWESSQVHVN